jgi:hypothetical protein
VQSGRLRVSDACALIGLRRRQAFRKRCPGALLLLRVYRCLFCLRQEASNYVSTCRAPPCRRERALDLNGACMSAALIKDGQPDGHHGLNVGDVGALRRSCGSSPRQNSLAQALTLARRGSARRCARHPRSGAPRRQSRQTLLQAPAEGIGLCAAGDSDRQVEKLRRGKTPPASRRRASTKPISEQSRRKLTVTDTASGTADATVQIDRAGPALPVRSRIHPWPLPATPPSAGG